MTTLHGFESALGQPLDTCFGLSQFHGHTYIWALSLVILEASWDGRRSTFFWVLPISLLLASRGPSVSWYEVALGHGITS